MAFNIDNISSDRYEWLALPSGGKCYPITSSLRSGKIALFKLTAKDLDVFATLIARLKDNLNIIDLFQNDLQKLIVDNSINILQLCKPDVEMIVLWLQQHCVDANNDMYDVFNFSYCELLGKPDENGFFEYVSKSNEHITFRLLPFIDEIEIRKDYDSNMFEFLSRSIVSIVKDAQQIPVTDFLLSGNSSILFDLLDFITISMPAINIVRIIDDETSFMHYSLF